MPSVCFYFQVHQPSRLRRYSIFDVDRNYFDSFGNAEICRKLAQKCYIRANRSCWTHPPAQRALPHRLLAQRHRHGPFQRTRPRRAGGPSRNWPTLAAWSSSPRTTTTPELFVFTRGVRRAGQAPRRADLAAIPAEAVSLPQHRVDLQQRPGPLVAGLGYKGILCEGALAHCSPNHVYRTPGTAGMTLLLRNTATERRHLVPLLQPRLAGVALTADKFAHWIAQIKGSGDVANLFMNYEAFGDRLPADCGIFEFLAHLPDAVSSTRTAASRRPRN